MQNEPDKPQERELPPSPDWARMATPQPKTVLFDTPRPHPVGEKRAFDGSGDADGADAFHDFFGPIFWRFLGVHDDDYSTVPGYSRLKDGSAVVTRESQVDAILDFGLDYSKWCLDLHGNFDPTSEEARLLVGEEEHGRKMTVMKGYYEGYQHSPPSPPRLQLPSWYHDMMAKLIQHYLHASDPRVESVEQPKIVIPTGAGWPIFQPGIGAKVLSASFWQPGRRFTQLRDAAADWAAGHNVDPVSTFGNGYGTRTGTNIKETPFYKFDGVRLRAIGAYTSRCCRRRQIYMASIVNVLLLRDFTRIAKATRKNVIPGAWHTGDDDALHIMSVAHVDAPWLEADISGYDTSLTRDHHLAFLRAVKRFRPDLTNAADDYAAIDDLGTIFPHPGGTGRDNRHARYVTRQGLLSSGILPTAEMGNIYHLPIILELAKRCGMQDPIRSLLSKQWAILIQGDDLLIKLPGLTKEMMEETYLEAGLKVKAVMANRFLMRHRFGGRWYAVAARVFQQTAFAEHEPLGPYALPLSVIGFVARMENGVHPLVADKIREFMSLTDLAKEGIVDLESGRAWLNSARGSKLVEAALAAVASQSWAERIRRDAEYSPSSAAILRLATQFGLADPDLAEGVLGNRAIDKLLSLPAARRISVRDALWAAVNDGLGGEPLDALALKLLQIDRT